MSLKHMMAGIVLAFATLLASSAMAQPTPVKVARIGYLGGSNPDIGGPGQSQVFLQALRELGWVEGRNLVVEYRWAEGKLERFPINAAELADLKVDVIFSTSTAGTLAAKQATHTIPVVFHVYDDPVHLGLADSLAHPGRNMTGLSVMSVEISAKRLELLKEAFPKISRVAVLVNPAHVSSALQLKETQRAAAALGITLLPIEAQRPEDFGRAYAMMAKQRADALIVIENPTFFFHRKLIVELAAKSARPTMYGMQPFVEDGGLMSYSVNYPDQFRRAAMYVDKILRGARPGDLPVEQPTTFELLINLKTAKALGIRIPQSILIRAANVIE
jgi:putative tryptophan/tyrosine transport system substrate-binding protein